MASAREVPRPVRVTIRTRVTAEEFDQLAELAEDDCSNVSQVVRRMLRQQLRVHSNQASHGAA